MGCGSSSTDVTSHNNTDNQVKTVTNAGDNVVQRSNIQKHDEASTKCNDNDQGSLRHPVSKEDYLKRMKQSVEDCINEINSGGDEYTRIGDYKEQLQRWLAVYPNVKLDNKMVDYEVDPNQMPFPLHERIKNVQKPLQLFLETYEPFDTELPAEGAWTMIELDLVKNDVTTVGQEDVWKSRGRRTNLNDAEWMRKRRQEIADILTRRHEWPPGKVETYLQFADNLEKGWKQFQEICD